MVFRSDIVTREVVDLNETVDEGAVDLSLIENPVLITTLSGRELENLTISLDVNEYYPPGQIVVKNNANVDLMNVEYSIIGDAGEILDVKPMESEILIANEGAVVLVFINEAGDFDNGEFAGSFDIKVGDMIVGSLPIFVNVYGAAEVEAGDVNKSADAVSDEKDSVTTVIEPEEGRGFGLWVFLIFVFVLLLVLFYVYKKTKRKKEEFEGYIERIKR